MNRHRANEYRAKQRQDFINRNDIRCDICGSKEITTFKTLGRTHIDKDLLNWAHTADKIDEQYKNGNYSPRCKKHGFLVPTVGDRPWPK